MTEVINPEEAITNTVETIINPNSNFKKVFLMTMIIALSISAFLGIIIFLTGSMGEIQIKILLTTLAIGGFSLLGLCSAILHDKKTHTVLAWIGIITSVLAFLAVLTVIWNNGIVQDIWKPILTLVVLSVTFAHISLLLLIKSSKTVVNTLLSLTILSASIVALMLINLIYFPEIMEKIGGFYFRLLGVVAILDALGTVVTPIALKITKI